MSRALLRVMPLLGLEAVQRVGAAMGPLAEAVAGRRKKRVRQHLEWAFPEPQYDAEFRERIYRESFRSLAQMALETVWSPAWKPERDDWRVGIPDEENFRGTLRLAKEHGRGIVIYSAHHGSPELLAQWLVRHSGIPVMAVAGKAKSEALEAPLLRWREGYGLIMVNRGDAGMATLRHLKGGGALVMLVDHNLRGRGAAVPFFGRPAHTLLAPARLALQSGAVWNTLFVLREGRGRFAMDFGRPALPEPYAKDKEERFRQEALLAAEYTRRIEESVRRHPEQFLWTHDRWHHRSDTLPMPS